MIYTETYPPSNYCDAAYTRASPIDALTLPPFTINGTLAVLPRANHIQNDILSACCIYDDEFDYYYDSLDQCWYMCEILGPRLGLGGDSSARFSSRPDDLGLSLGLARRGLAQDGIKAFESCMKGKGVDIGGMKPRAEYYVVGTDGRTKPLASGGVPVRASLGRGLGMTWSGLGLVGLVCLGLLV